MLRFKLSTQLQAALSLLAALTMCSTAQAQSNWAKIAVPIYSSAQVLSGLHQYWTAPRADEFASQASALPPMIKQMCDAKPPAAQELNAARLQWKATTQAWERLSTVAVGPLIERRSQRQIDFLPTRPALIERAIAAEPADAAAMERVGTPAKGLPALEWLLWTQPITPESAACRYAVQVALDVEREAIALQSAFKALASTDWADADPDKAAAGMSELVNQWVGGLERLRWAQMEKPLRSAQTKTAKSMPDWPRTSSGSTAQSWATQWDALRTLAVFSNAAPANAVSTNASQAPVPGQALVPLETYLRSKGRNPVADALVAAVRQADHRMKTLSGMQKPTAPQVLATAKALGEVKKVAESQLASALDVNLGFSDADGD
jgi:uncharacterized protein